MMEVTERAFDEMVYFRVHEGCNLHCDHCFIPKNPKKIKLEDASKVIQKAAHLFSPGKKIKFQWHGGEPTLVKIDYFKYVIQFLKDSYPEVEFQHTIQTNLYSFDRDWGELFLNHFNGEVGVSWDYKIRKYAGDNGVYEKSFWEKMELLQSMGLSPYLVITTTKLFFKRFKNPFSLITFLKEKKITHVHFERLTKTGYAVENWDAIGVDNLEYSKWMSRFYKAYLLYREESCNQQSFGSFLSISPFDGLRVQVENLVSGVESSGYGCWSKKCDSNFHTIDALGYQKGCTAVTSETNNPNKLYKEIKVEPVIVNIKSIRSERQEGCHGCDFINICSTGCTATEKFDASGECSGAKVLFESIKASL